LKVCCEHKPATFIFSLSAPEEDIKQSSIHDDHQMSQYELTKSKSWSCCVGVEADDDEQEFGRGLDLLIDNFLVLGEVPFGMLLGLSATSDGVEHV
jgi:hypothetical protein